MNLAAPAENTSEPTEAQGYGRFAAAGAIVIMAVLGGAFLWNVAPYWEVNPQYSFGWLVPFLSIILLVRRWPNRPPPEPARSPVARILVAAIAFLFLPTWLVVQPNPDWRFSTWLLALEFIGVTLGLIYFLGGRSWVSYFAFPVAFLLTAVPWPFGLEFPLVESLMQSVTAVTVEVLSWFNVAAVQHGNLIEVRTGVLGVDEACSGIRSLQATLMASLFLGEFYGLRVSRRLLLVAVGVALAFICNVGRAFFIAYVAARDGLDAVSRWHDPAGYTILTLCLIGIWIVAQFCGPAPIKATPVEAEASARRPGIMPLPRGLLVGVAIWLVASVAATEAWYRWHEGGEKIRWTIQWPKANTSLADLPIPERARDLLLFDEGKAVSWKQPDGAVWSVFFFRWNAGSSRSRVVPRSHRPDICFPASGYTLEGEEGVVRVRAKGIDIPFRTYRFSKDGQEVRVYFCLWQDKPEDADTGAKEWSRLAGLELALRGQRNLSQQVLEISTVGYDSPQAAEAALRAELEKIIAPEPNRSTEGQPQRS
jgi:exosortase